MNPNKKDSNKQQKSSEPKLVLTITGIHSCNNGDTLVIASAGGETVKADGLTFAGKRDWYKLWLNEAPAEEVGDQLRLTPSLYNVNVETSEYVDDNTGEEKTATWRTLIPKV
jgi:hypothetical protein